MGDLILGENHSDPALAAGVTDGALLKGVRFFGDGMRTHCLVMTTLPRQVRFIDTIHAKDDPDVRIRF